MLRLRVIGEGMGRGNGESITTTAMTSRHTNVSETNQCPTFVAYRTVEVRMNHMLTGACARPPSRPYALACSHVCASKTSMANMGRGQNDWNSTHDLTSTGWRVKEQNREDTVQTTRVGRTRCKKVMGRGNITCSGIQCDHKSWGRRHQL